jgi:hypothetical protein
MANAQLILKTRTTHKGGIVEMVVWQVPAPVPPSEYGFKYRLVYVRRAERVVGYDNERGKGDHKHLGQREMKYRFTSIDRLIADFLADVEAHTP